MDSDSNVTLLLTQAADGCATAKDALFRMVSTELRVIAANYMRKERVDHSLQPTVLVNDAFLRLVGEHVEIDWKNRTHFFRAASKAMRQMLVDHERQRLAKKRGGNEYQRIAIDPDQLISENKKTIDILALDEAIEKLAELDPRQASIVQFRHFCGRTLQETAELIGVSVDTVKAEWRLAKAWLHRELNRQ